jgi:heme O synthase-like polyprenyltransferase
MRISERKKIVADYKKMLIEKHWEQAQSITKERMWICGLYAALWGFILSGKADGIQINYVYFSAFILGLFALSFCLKLNYLYEIHMRRAQIYLAQDSNEGLLTAFGKPTLKFLSISFLLCLFNLLGALFGLFLFVDYYITEHSDWLIKIITPMFFLILSGLFAIVIWKLNGRNFKIAAENSSNKFWKNRLFLG